ncbi:ATPase, AAA family/ putative Methanol dehydrogenase regulatory protein MoxR [Candidatus Vecturithrix granuli]|uniref:ATPase, AAA family/ putative Methanol dehydrogenase regulatory protein MoxR n=1 Tax=Vecturithrix granuli TaxID=1499967 RepID=A0A081C2S6_VECG1|nr:ATPase, AAA family/ putative Methanol dehydrogenase regulatory protein MoxR [Candidatus Vecturithrix granuli]
MNFPNQQTAMNELQQIQALQQNIERVIIGKPDVVRLAIIALLAEGHLLIEDVPGVGKTTLAHALAKSIDCTFQRIQFTSDMLPSDIIGVSVYNQQRREFEFQYGPIFANIVLADEINRTTPKTQSSLLEAMSERQVSVDGITHHLKTPFMVLATQNPLEYHGTYPLPESQLDRFFMRLRIGYPAPDQEKAILKAERSMIAIEHLQPVLSARDVTAIQAMVDQVPIDESLQEYIIRIVNRTRTSKWLELGASPRGTLALQRAARASALIAGRQYCLPDDIKALAVSVLAHRVMLQTDTLSETGAEDAERVIQEIVAETPVPL